MAQIYKSIKFTVWMEVIVSEASKAAGAYPALIVFTLSN